MCFGQWIVGRSDRVHLKPRHTISYLILHALFSLIGQLNEEDTVKNFKEALEDRRVTTWKETGSLNHGVEQSHLILLGF